MKPSKFGTASYMSEGSSSEEEEAQVKGLNGKEKKITNVMESEVEGSQMESAIAASEGKNLEGASKKEWKSLRMRRRIGRLKWSRKQCRIRSASQASLLLPPLKPLLHPILLPPPLKSLKMSAKQDLCPRWLEVKKEEVRKAVTPVRREKKVTLKLVIHWLIIFLQAVSFGRELLR